MINQLKAFDKQLLKPDELIYVVNLTFNDSYISEFILTSGLKLCKVNGFYIRCLETGRSHNGMLYYDYPDDEIVLFVDKLNIPGLSNNESPCVVFYNLKDAQMWEQIWRKSGVLPSMLKAVDGITKIPFELNLDI